MARLTCAYCGSVIKRRDTKCPHCGAETESSIIKFMKAREAETENHKSLLEDLRRKRRKLVISLVLASAVSVILSVLLFILVSPTTARTVIFALLVTAYAICLVTAIKGIRKNYSECCELNARLDGLSHDIIFDCEEVQPYKMINDVETMNNDGCYRAGLQQIAFKVRITNGSSKKTELTLCNEFFAKNEKFGYHVWLNADGVRMEDCTLVPFFEHHEENNKVFEPPLYPEGLREIALRPHESIAGWVAFYVTPEAADLELLFADDHVMVKNPLIEEK